MTHNKDGRNKDTAFDAPGKHNGDSPGRAVGKTERGHQGTEHMDDMNLFFEIY